MNRSDASKSSKWIMDFNSNENTQNVDAPPGYHPTASVKSVTKIGPNQRLLLKKSWDLALEPFKSIPMNLLFIYTSSNSIALVSFTMLHMMLMRTIESTFTTKTTSKMAKGVLGYGPKLVYHLGNLANVGLVMYNCHKIGLLPTSSSDWLAFAKAKYRLEFSSGGIILS